MSEVDEYDLVSGSWSLLRRTLASYTSLGNNIFDRVSSVTVQDGGGSPQAQTNYYYDQPNTLSPTSGVPQHVAVSGSRGNLTQISQWLNTTGGYLNTNLTYDDTGNVLSSKDPGGHTTSFDYTDSWSGSGCAAANTLAYVTTITNALGQQTKNSYYPCTGLAQSTKDQNDISASRAGTTYSYDLMGRLLSTNYPDGGQTSFNYNGYPTPPHITTTVLATPNPSIVTDDYYDSLGRISSHQLTSDPEGADSVNTTYDALGRVLTVTNPQRSSASPTDGTTCYGTMINGVCTPGYDALGRLTVITEQDGNTVNSTFSDRCVTTSDETGRARQLCSDALGRLTDVYEPNPTTGSLTSGSFHTSYQYDLLNNLKTITQYGDGNGTRTRSFTYDSLSRLLDATNPETGLVCYGSMSGSTCNRDGYDADGNLLHRTDGRGLMVSFQYDQLHRLTARTYSDGSAPHQFYYDTTPSFWTNGPSPGSSIGRLTYATNDVNAAYGPSYDARGRITGTRYCIPSDCNYDLNTTASYDLAGHLTSLTYPSGRTITQTYNAAGRPYLVKFASFNGTAVNYTYWSAPWGTSWQTDGYWPTGAVHLVSLGNGTFAATDFNNRLQQTDVLIGAPTNWNVNSVNRWISKSLAYEGNGNITTVSDTLNSGRQQNFLYDKLNRITNASTTATSGPDAWTQSFVPDPWGNTKQSGSGAFLQTFDTNNHIAANQGYTYDAAGNLTNDTFHAYVYDSESRIKSIDGNVSYTYDADENRVRKDVSGSDPTEYIYFQGQPIAEHDPNTGDWSDYIYANGQRIAKADSFEYRIHIAGNNCSNCGWQYTTYWLPVGWLPYTIQTGDKLYFRQWQSTGARGGVGLSFTDGSNSNWVAQDQDGQQLNNDNSPTQVWHTRIVDLSQFAGKIMNTFDVVADGYTQPGAWDIYYDKISIISQDGTVHPIYTSETSESSSLGGTSGVTGRLFEVNHSSWSGPYPSLTTTYYHQDHLGTARLLTSDNGWPIWQGTFLPFGQEWNPQMTMNHYKFADLEHDAESNLEHTQFRQLSTTQGRWLSPDPYMGSMDLTNPQSLNRYAYVMNDPLNGIDPLGLGDCDKDPSACPPQLGSGNYTISITVSAPFWVDFVFEGAPAGMSMQQVICMVLGGCAPQQSSSSSGGGTAQSSQTPPVVRSFSRSFQCAQSAQGVISTLESNFGQFANFSGTAQLPTNIDTFGGADTVVPENVTFLQHGPLNVGQVIPIDGPFGFALPLNSSAVSVSSVSSTSFSFTTIKGAHPFDHGTVTFSAANTSGGIRFNVSVQASFSSLFSRLFFKMGGAQLESSIWNNLLNNVQNTICKQ